jgi:WD40 repeat protein
VGDKLISSSTDGTVRIWSLQDYSALLCIHAHEGAITELVCDGTRILTGSADGNVKLWKFQTGELIRELVMRTDAVWKGGIVGDRAVAVYSKNGNAIVEVCSTILLINSTEERQLQES